MPRVLIFKFGAIGDVIMAIPAAHQLHLYGHLIDWVCGPAVLPILRLYPWIKPILADDQAILRGSPMAKLKALWQLWLQVTKHTYDLAAILYYDPRYRILVLPVRATRKFQLSLTDRATRIIPGRHHTDEVHRILFNLPDQVRPTALPPTPPQIFVPSPLASPVRTRIVMAPAGARNMMAEAILRRWPIENYVNLATKLLACNFEVVLIGSLDDIWIRPLFSHLPVLDITGTLTLPETIAALASAHCVISHDTGPLHLAGVTNASVVALFGPTNPRYFAPRRPGVVSIWGGEGFACRPCYDGRSFAACPANDCMRQITVEMVLVEIERMLEDRERGYLAPPRVVVPASVQPSGVLTQIEGARL